ncbi:MULTISPECIES: aminotransferase class III-fold pyridoxal phosphate-dependent enzyme [unclassified Arcicella]|uniref:aminotransferase class III-fold pyridoxal phosphate-dependent enzyme n=1 Tax=unclassified Arcicella TaxID=2644986 RepID=UPI002859EDC6|nr:MULTISPECIES: aminotransferase class III-fold pyridoxal phosphate-dependent enzyme [unclassified Arcicella]MDR6561409.1 glutamate-1-semialdehyde aminotransferase [Arcicella sp. BE51]MDR6811293.1 glutamate-1-semialdehyde aminotransferase [Arcicella sp. BE140]MDR6822643.1 glutamate-1-semialdehyde aminotransferase [Arcicella sp. BE139]
MPNSIKSNDNYPTITESDSLYNRALKVQKPITQTLAKGPGQFTKGVAPKYLKKGKGSHVWDVDGNEYIDFNAAIGPLSLGYAYPVVDEAIKQQLEDGITFSLMHPLEVELSELIQEVIPNAEAVKISKTGADVCSAAIRVARAFTGREKIFCCGYHGWHDWYIGITSRNAGIPEAIQNMTYTFEYNNIQAIREALDEDVAAIILEPFIFEAPQNNFLQELATLCRENGTLLIFDEMWTGFRIALGGAQEYFNVVPDLAVYSKACANGMPIALLTGRADVMELFNSDVFSYTTFGGEALSLAASIATIKEIRDKNVPAYLDAKGQIIKDGYNEIAKEFGLENLTKCIGYNCRSMVTFAPEAGNGLEVKALVQQEMIKRGVLWAGFHNMCFSHSDEDINYTLSAYREVMPILKEAIESNDLKSYLKGEVLEAVFRKTSNYNIKPALAKA